MKLSDQMSISPANAIIDQCRCDAMITVMMTLMVAVMVLVSMMITMITKLGKDNNHVAPV